MLDTLITSKTRIKLLLKFFLNPSTSAYLRGLATEFNESSNAIRIELNRLEDAGMLRAEFSGNKKLFQVNMQHPLYNPINDIVRKYVGIDQILENILKGLGDLEEVYMTGTFALGRESNEMEFVLVGDINKTYLHDALSKAEKAIHKKIKLYVYTSGEVAHLNLNKQDFLLVYKK